MLNFNQRLEITISSVQDTIDEMPVGMWACFLDNMYTPFLKRLVHADPKGILPSKWMLALPSRRPPRSLRQNYYDLCAILHMDRSMHGPGCREVLEKIHKPAYDLLHGLLNKDPYLLESRDAFMGLVAQLQMMTGQYSTYRFVKNYLRDYDGVDFLVGYIIKSGATEFVLESARGLAQDLTQHRPDHDDYESTKLIYIPSGHALSALIKGLKGYLKGQRARKIAVAMALHGRLGAGSGLGALGSDLLAAMVPADPPRQVFWHEMRSEFFRAKCE